jgi:hypothetical protein
VKKKKQVGEVEKLCVGMQVKHATYGKGTVVEIARKGGLRHRRQINLGVDFARGGPKGWAPDASNNAAELSIIR